MRIFCAGSPLVNSVLNFNPLPLYVPFAKVWNAVIVGDPDDGLSWVVATNNLAFTAVASAPSKSVHVSINAVLESNNVPI